MLFLQDKFSTQHKAEAYSKKKKKMIRLLPKCADHLKMIVEFWCGQCEKRACCTCFELHREGHTLVSYEKQLHKRVRSELGPTIKKTKEVYTLAEKVMERCAFKM